MTTQQDSISQPTTPHLRRSNVLRRVIHRDKTPLATLVLAAIVGTLAGLMGVAFERSVDWVQQQRLAGLAEVANYWYIVWPAAILGSAVLAMFGYYLVRRFAPEAGGSGIPEIEGALEDLRPARWWRVIPVKFLGGMGTLGAGMVLGREGPTVQMGGNLGQMVYDLFRLPKRDNETRHTLLATGAAAGLTAAFNAPLAGILFIIEEMRPQFHYSLVSIKAVFIGVIMSCVVFRFFNGEHSVIEVGRLGVAEINTLWLYLVLGMVFGIVGVLFNQGVFRTQDMFMRMHGGDWRKLMWIGAALGGLCGALGLIQQEAAGGGFALIPIAAEGNYTVGMLLFIFIARVVTTLLCFSSGAPGGIFAPMLALGTLLGTAFGMAAAYLFPHYGIDPGTFAIAGMGALFAATVRAPLTGIVLVLEMTDNVFVWLMLFSYFAVPASMQRRVLVYGVLGAIILRTVMIFAGSWLVTQFQWILYLFGAFLLFTGIKMAMSHDDEGDLGDRPLVRWLRRHLRMTDRIESEHFFTRRNGVLFATPLLLVLILVELSDVIFAVDSIPAIFAVTTDPFLVLTSNLFAILGLRAMYFLLAGVAERFSLLKYGLAAILTFIGIKMLIIDFYHIPIAVSLATVAGILALTLLINAWVNHRRATRSPR